MRSNTLLLFVVAAASTSTLAAPVHPAYEFAYPRDVSGEVDESGALNWGKIFSTGIKVIPKVLGWLGGGSGGNSTRRAFEDDLYVREEPTELFVRGVINPNDPNLSKDKLTQWWNNLDPAVRAKLQTYEPAVAAAGAKQSRMFSAAPEEIDSGLEAREDDEDDESGAFVINNHFWGGPGPVRIDPKFSMKLPAASETRDFVDELLRRAAEDDDESGAINWGKIFSTGLKVIPKVLGWLDGGSGGNSTRRAVEDQDDASGSLVLPDGHPYFGIGPEIPAGGWNLTDVLLRRAAEDDDESGALNWGKIFSTGIKVIPKVLGWLGGGSGGNSTRRAFEELLARDESGAIAMDAAHAAQWWAQHGGISSVPIHFPATLEDREDETDAESGALNWGGLIEDGLKFIPKVIGWLGGGGNSTRRAFEDIYVRENVESGALDIMIGGHPVKWGPFGLGHGPVVHEPIQANVPHPAQQSTPQGAQSGPQSTTPQQSTPQGSHSAPQQTAPQQSVPQGYVPPQEKIQARELVELLARAAAADESAALNIGGIIGALGRGLLGLLGGGSSDNQQQSRELVQLLTRAMLEEH